MVEAMEVDMAVEADENLFQDKNSPEKNNNNNEKGAKKAGKLSEDFGGRVPPPFEPYPPEALRPEDPERLKWLAHCEKYNAETFSAEQMRRTVLVKSWEGFIFPVRWVPMLQSKVFAQMWTLACQEDWDQAKIDATILFPLHEIPQHVFEWVLDWMVNHHARPDPVIKEHPITKDRDAIPRNHYETRYFDGCSDQFLKLVYMAANYLDVPSLFYHCAQECALRIQGKSGHLGRAMDEAEIRHFLNLPDDVTDRDRITWMDQRDLYLYLMDRDGKKGLLGSRDEPGPSGTRGESYYPDGHSVEAMLRETAVEDCVQWMVEEVGQQEDLASQGILFCSAETLRRYEERFRREAAERAEAAEAEKERKKKVEMENFVKKEEMEGKNNNNEQNDAKGELEKEGNPEENNKNKKKLEEENGEEEAKMEQPKTKKTKKASPQKDAEKDIGEICSSLEKSLLKQKEEGLLFPRFAAATVEENDVGEVGKQLGQMMKRPRLQQPNENGDGGDDGSGAGGDDEQRKRKEEKREKSSEN